MFVTESLKSKIFVLTDVLHETAGYMNVAFVLVDPVSEEHDALMEKAMERLVHIAIEGIADIGNLLIDTLVMRDAASYADIIDILSDEHVITSDVAEVLLPMLEFRRTLMQDYQSAHAAKVLKFVEHASYIDQFADQVTEYLKNNE
ncbi:DUF86 domain-containing protein [Sulfoacidibacillus ferrooxidans]|uniref:DUF86 domain-containing protein n=1 Tax=Sulfoacidibacillus ferrooxidans TaxID=2005001 RepID=A0A9X2ABH2_9BACL|nr:HepT-like ribonuclease domain-containing protein [Sulfoacidibacillus ferrooxidans]MCI0182993.1 hypothetical protein [Sulfoacidibacillus ferrooxidans]